MNTQYNWREAAVILNNGLYSILRTEEMKRILRSADNHPELTTMLATDSSMNESQRREMLSSKSAREVAGTIMNRLTSANSVYLIDNSMKKDELVQIAIAMKPNGNPSMLHTFMGLKHSNNLSANVLCAMALSLTADKSIREYTSNHLDVTVRAASALNPHQEEENLHNLAQDVPYVIERLILHPKLKYSDIKNIYIRSNFNLDMRHIRELIPFNVNSAKHKDILLDKLNSSKQNDRCAIAMSLLASPGMLSSLCDDTHPDVRICAINNPKTRPSDVIRHINDNNFHVASAARERIKKDVWVL